MSIFQNTVILLCCVFIFTEHSYSVVVSCPYMVELDPEDASNYCVYQFKEKKLKPGNFCLIRPERVRPTQVFVGKVEMECTKREIESKNSSSLRQLLLENHVPAIIGPPSTSHKRSKYGNGTKPTALSDQDTAEFFITDHHHFAVALFQAFLDFKRPAIHRVLYACIQADYSAYTSEQFWSKMRSEYFVFLENERGENISVRDLPENLKLMADNPYRTFASWLRASYAYIKCGTKKTTKLKQCKESNAPFFLECYWANFLRKRFPINDYPIYPDDIPMDDFIYRASLQLQTEAMLSLLHKAIQSAIDPNQAQFMPGFNYAQDELPPVAVKLDDFGCRK